MARMKSGRDMETLQTRVPSSVVQWIDRFRNEQTIPPSRSEVIRFLVERGITEYAREGGVEVRRRRVLADGL